ncbi:MAG: NAD-dependent epimerase/dehydratase family protein [Planctomycetaceae bacterium]|nr:NAD-dependent epimerase/dehydratase family protein [Planctomycetaceae bacterium]
MPCAIVTGAAGLIGSETTRFLASQDFRVVGIDNDMRREFFGADASTAWSRRQLEEQVPGYLHHAVDIRDVAALEPIFSDHSAELELVVHAAAQPSHDWAARAPQVDFGVNAVGTLNLLELTRKYAATASFIFTSTNKVYGDTPNLLPLVETETRWEVAADHPFAEHGIDESMSIDQSKHSLFGASKVAGDVLVQEYGRYFGMNTVCFRGGCLTGPAHSGTQLHGFLSYLVKCAVTGQRYTVLGYKGKQVRDNIHAHDLVQMFWHYHQHPRPGEVYNAGGSRHSNCSIREVVRICEQVVGKPMDVTYADDARSGDHIWYISDVRKFQRHYPDWTYRYTLQETIEQIVAAMTARCG